MISYTIGIKWDRFYKGKTKHYEGHIFIQAETKKQAKDEAIKEFNRSILMPGEKRQLIDVN